MSSRPVNPVSASGLAFARDAWLSDVMTREVYRVSGVVQAPAGSEAERELREILEWSDFCYVRAPTDDVRTSQFLEHCGFRVVDTGVTLEMPRPASRVGGGRARFAKAGDLAAVEEIARRSFMYSRFHLDPRIPRPLADEIKAQWAGNYFRGQRGDHMVVAERAGVVVGFLQLLNAPAETLVIDLIAVAEGHRGLGLADEMIYFAADNCNRPTTLRVGTQIANANSLGLYQKMGFRVTASSYVLHYHGVPD